MRKTDFFPASRLSVCYRFLFFVHSLIHPRVGANHAHRLRTEQKDITAKILGLTLATLEAIQKLENSCIHPRPAIYIIFIDRAALKISRGIYSVDYDNGLWRRVAIDVARARDLSN